MRVKLMTFRYSATLGGFDDTPLCAFIRDKELLSLREHFFAVNEVPHLACVVTYRDAVVPPEVLQAAREIPRPQPSQSPPSYSQDHRPARFARDGRPDPAAGLSEPERVLFNSLREWRAKQAREDGVPPFLILTNRQALEIVAKKPESPTALGHIDGVGPGKIERYGRAILRALHGAPRAAAPAPAQEASSPPVEALAAALAEPPALVEAAP